MMPLRAQQLSEHSSTARHEQLLNITFSDPIGVPEAAFELSAAGNVLVEVKRSGRAGLVIDRKQARSARLDLCQVFVDAIARDFWQGGAVENDGIVPGAVEEFPIGKRLDRSRGVVLSEQPDGVL